jgi:hypothetical protein
MTLARRVAAVELTLSPTELVLRWLEEARAHGDLEAYVLSIIADPVVVPPADQLGSGGSALTAPWPIFGTNALWAQWRRSHRLAANEPPRDAPTGRT